ncbi:MAG TPA: hypothetical protein VFL47_17515, partial [Flavisolibacter sp.]|nr:hypothetical protein [Flavisolibacter sp.]
MIKIGLKGIFLFVLTGMMACGRAENHVAHPTKTGGEKFESIAHNEAFSEISLDSADVEKFIRSHHFSDKRAVQLRQFYRSRDYQFAWFNGDGLAQQGRAFWNLHNQYLNVTRDSSFFNRKLHRQMQALLDDEELERTDYNITNLDMELTDHFFDYARYAYAGKIDPNELQWHIPRKKINSVALLDSLIQKNGRQLDQWEPVSRLYKLVRKEV